MVAVDVGGACTELFWSMVRSPDAHARPAVDLSANLASSEYGVLRPFPAESLDQKWTPACSFALRTPAGPVKGHRCPAWLRPPCRELCTEAEHEPVDSLVHETLVASSVGDNYAIIPKGAETPSRGEISVFFGKHDHNSERLNLFKRFSESVDIIPVQRPLSSPGRDGRQNGPRNRRRQSGRTGTDPTGDESRKSGLPRDA